MLCFFCLCPLQVAKKKLLKIFLSSIKTCSYTLNIQPVVVARVLKRQQVAALTNFVGCFFFLLCLTSFFYLSALNDLAGPSAGPLARKTYSYSKVAIKLPKFFFFFFFFPAENQLGAGRVNPYMAGGSPTYSLFSNITFLNSMNLI